MHILITGGAGFIGAHVARALLDRGETVTIIDDFNDRYDPRLKEDRLEQLVLLAYPQVTVLRVDITQTAQILEIFASHRFDQVIHLAAWAAVQPSMINPHAYTAVNVDGTVNILEAARLHAVKNVVIASSSSVYGGLTELPFHEDMNVSQPISPYAASKVATEIMAATWHNMYQVPITCLRFFTVYGPWGRPEMAMFKFAEAIRLGQTIEMRGTTTQRDFTYIDDIVQGVVAALDQPQKFAVFNLSESQAINLPTIIQLLEKAIGRPAHVIEVPLPPGDIPATLADISRAQQLLHYHPVTPIETGIKNFVQWYLQWYVPKFATETGADLLTTEKPVHIASLS